MAKGLGDIKLVSGIPLPNVLQLHTIAQSGNLPRNDTDSDVDPIQLQAPVASSTDNSANSGKTNDVTTPDKGLEINPLVPRWKFATKRYGSDVDPIQLQDPVASSTDNSANSGKTNDVTTPDRGLEINPLVLMIKK
uniref:Uncharacterized protein n=1 Tax=Glossina palpalis gambiensis TaxID=67801 RepID=A0A1B0B1X0_9MUSC